MAEDMKLRNLASKTIDSYTYHVGRFAEFLGKSLEDATPEDVFLPAGETAASAKGV